MAWFLLAQLFSTVIQLVLVRRMSDQQKELEILILRQQLAICERKLLKPLKPSRAEKLTLTVLVARLKQCSQQSAGQLRHLIRIFQPETVLRWHRDLVRRKWSYPRKNNSGRPPIDQEIEELIIRFARENASWGYGKIAGELAKLGFKVSQSTVRNVLERHGLVPAPVRHGSLGWRQLMAHYKQQILACDFFTVETLWLQTLYVFFFIELGTRRVHLAGVTTHPNGLWVAQQARQYVWTLEDSNFKPRILIHDNDKKFTTTFDDVFRSERIRIIPTPIQAPNANAFAERWVRTVREECLDRLLILNEAHLRRVLKGFVDYYNNARPHQGLDQQTPIPHPRPNSTGPIQRREVLGIISDYYRGPDPAALSLA